MTLSAARSACIASGRAASELDLGLEDRHRLTADPYTGELAAGEFELDLHAAGTMQRVSLHAAKARALAVAGEEPEPGEVGAEQPVRVAAHRVLGDAECRTEHARFGEVI